MPTTQFIGLLQSAMQHIHASVGSNESKARCGDGSAAAAIFYRQQQQLQQLLATSLN